MQRRTISLICAMALALFLTAAQPVSAEGPAFDIAQREARLQPDGGIMLADVLIARPIGMAACAVGLVGTVLALPFATFSGNIYAVAERLVVEPFVYTFQRPVGHFPGELPSR
ncbi:MAG: hypothetical protein ACUVSA_12125 [Desulfosoma sp.]|uniref:hypothetical protein n=1 Tax=Desulfosoma sp. TaxID=2603217 RepID=UPI004049B278